MLWFKHSKNTIFFVTILLLASVPAIWSLLLPGFFETEDGNWMIIRFSAFYQALREGQFPVRNLLRLNQGYGYPVATFLYPGFMYAGVVIKALGFGFQTTIKLLLAMSLIFSGLFTFAWLSKIFDKKKALVGALYYIYTPYHLFDIYKRGSVGEVVALTWPPFVLWAIESNRNILTSIGVALLILSHNTLALFFLPVIFVYGTLHNYKKTTKKHLKNFYLSLVLGMGLTAFFSFPALYELQFTKFSQITISDPTNYFASADTLGISTIIIITASIGVFLAKKKRKYKNTILFYLFVFVGVTTVLLASPISSELWSIIPSSFIQFPFRLLSITIICISFLAAYSLTISQNTVQKVLLVVIITSLIFSSARQITPSSRTNYADEFYSTNQATTTVQNEYMPIWVEQEPAKQSERVIEAISGDVLFSNVSKTNSKVSFNTVSNEPSIVQINVIYWPGWHATVDGVEKNISHNNPEGVIIIPIQKGRHAVELAFKETSSRVFANGISVMSLILVAFWALSSILTTKNNKSSQLKQKVV